MFQGPSSPKYYTGYSVCKQPRTPSAQSLPPELARLTSLGNDYWDLRLSYRTVTAQWRDILIAEGPPPIKWDVSPILCSALHSITLVPPCDLASAASGSCRSPSCSPTSEGYICEVYMH